VFKDFRTFLLRGNVVDLAVAVVIGAAFGAVIVAFIRAFVTPLITLIIGKPSFGGLNFVVRGVVFPVGEFVTALLAFVAVAAVVFFFVVVPVNKLVERSRKEPPADPTTKKCPECLSEIPIDAKRCAHCTQPVSG